MSTKEFIAALVEEAQRLAAEYEARKRELTLTLTGVAIAERRITLIRQLLDLENNLGVTA